VFADRATFSHILEKSDVTSNSDVINQLFEALSTGSDEVDPEIFASFYHTWIQVRLLLEWLRTGGYICT